MLALMADLPDPVSARIQWLLAHTGRSKRAMSLASGLAASQVERLLVRGASGASLETLRKLADAAGCSLAWLVSGTGEPFDVEGQRPANDLPSREHRLAHPDVWRLALAILVPKSMMAAGASVGDVAAATGAPWWAVEQRMAQKRAA